MTIYDVFNGDADGICSLVQLRNAEPQNSQLVTGVKRDIQLMRKISPESGDVVNVLDVSFDKNRGGVEKALAAGAEVFYIDHHFSGDLPEHPKLTTRINLSANVCTSLLVNGYLKGQYAKWAIVGAFGDNLKDSALTLSKKIGLSNSEIEQLEHLGVYINYNGYGSCLEDLHFTPEQLYRSVVQYADPLLFMNDSKETFQKLEQGYKVDMAKADAIQAEFSNESVAAFILPHQTWSNRVSGVYSNDLANKNPSRGHAVLTEKDNGNYLISVRAPLANKVGADELCRRFPTGGGRAAAAGINELPSEQLSEFLDQFNQFYSV